MENRLTVTLGGQSYTLLAEEEDSYMKQVAELVNTQLAQVSGAGKNSLLDSAMLAALNLADTYLKEKNAADNLRQQLKDELEANAGLKAELAAARRQLFRLAEEQSQSEAARAEAEAEPLPAPAAQKLEAAEQKTEAAEQKPVPAAQSPAPVQSAAPAGGKREGRGAAAVRREGRARGGKNSSAAGTENRKD